jgi:hypothetical protein
MEELDRRSSGGETETDECAYVWGWKKEVQMVVEECVL